MSEALKIAYEKLASSIAANYGDADLSLVARAFDLLTTHRSENRAQHALETATLLANMRMDPASIATCFVAPVWDHIGREKVEKDFGAEVANLVEGVRRLNAIRWDRLEEEAAESLRKMFLAIAQEVRVVIVVLAIRVEKMRDLSEELDEKERRRIAQETLEIYAPLANRLGIWHFKVELENNALRELDPQGFNLLQNLLAETKGERQGFIDESISILTEKLAEQGIKAVVKGRVKHLSGIYRKMQRKDVGFDQIYDVAAVRIIVPQSADCYAALGLVHSIWIPVPRQFKDFIARPKENMYQSLHTAVLGPGGRQLEVQIRSHEMNAYAEYGVAAHWAYKEGRKATKTADRKFMVLRQLMDWEREVNDPHQFAESLKTDIFKDQVYVFTPAGDIIDLPQGSTPLDFAYRVHTMVGHRYRGAKVNDQIAPLEYQLKTGDRVEILTGKKASPSRDWMNASFGYLRTASGRSKVRQWFRAQGKELSTQQGKEIVEKEISRLGIDHISLEEIAKHLEYSDIDDMFAAVGFGDRSSASVASTAILLERQKTKAPPEPPPPESVPTPAKYVASGVSLGGVSDIQGGRARCCKPMPGDKVIGYISRGRGMIIHRKDCPQIAYQNEPERFVEIDWGTSGERYLVDIEVRAEDRPGLIRDISELCVQMGINVRSAKGESIKSKARLRLSLELANSDQVAQIVSRISRYPNVIDVRRIGR